MNSIAELNEIEEWAVLVYPVFAPILFVPAFHSSHLFLVLVLTPVLTLVLTPVLTPVP
jgi:hypothetical protein